MHMNWNYPTAVRVGAGRITELPAACRELGMQSPLLVTDPGLAQLPMIPTAVQGCLDAGLNCALFSNIKPNPTGSNIVTGVATFREGQHDGVIAFGGGSGLDAAKAIALMAGQQGLSLWDLEDIGDNWTRANTKSIYPVVAVPTTAGTGSEVGRASVIIREQDHAKKIIFHPSMLPNIVLLDPELTADLPAGLTAATGMDALSHSLEAYSSPLYHPMADGIAAEGIRLVQHFLPTAVTNGQDLAARTQMLVASSMGATAFQKGLGAMHALAHPLGALYDAHHGMLNAILMPYVLVANRDKISQRLERLGRYLNLPEKGFDGFLHWVLALRERIGIPAALSAIGIDDTRVDEIGPMAVADGAAGTNPVQFTADQYSKILSNAIAGHL